VSLDILSKLNPAVCSVVDLLAVTIVLGLMLQEIPCLFGKALSQKTLRKTISIDSLGGVALKW
jgi:hypothetical protein